MNSFKNVLIVVLLVAVAVLGYGAFNTKPAAPLGAAAGPDYYNHQNFAAGITVGGGIRATSTNDTSATMLASDFDEERVVDFTPNVVGITLALPASSTMRNFAPKPGDTRVIFIRNATTTAGADVLIAGGTGTLLKNASSTVASATVKGDTDAGNYARIDFIRKVNTDLEALVTTFQD